MNNSSAGGNPRGDGHGDGRGEFRKTPGVVYYGVPYYVPYVVYTLDAGTMTVPAPSSYPNPVASAATTSSAPPAVDQPAQKVLTLLAFKDHTILVVIDYWLSGDWLYYQTEPGRQASIPLGQLDLPLTQQLNRERNVRFVLESRP